MSCRLTQCSRRISIARLCYELQTDVSRHKSPFSAACTVYLAACRSRWVPLNGTREINFINILDSRLQTTKLDDIKQTFHNKYFASICASFANASFVLSIRTFEPFIYVFEENFLISIKHNYHRLYER